MSHLKPIDRETGKAKAYADYTPSERESALTQLSDEVLRRLSMNPPRPIDSSLADLIIQMAAGSEKANSLPPDVLEAATEKAKELLKRPAGAKP